MKFRKIKSKKNLSRKIPSRKQKSRKMRKIKHIKNKTKRKVIFRDKKMSKDANLLDDEVDLQNYGVN